jgi:thiol:disulfide interchange protein
MCSLLLLFFACFFTIGNFVKIEKKGLASLIIAKILAKRQGEFKKEGWLYGEDGVRVALEKKKPALLFFTAEWCIECKKMYPVFETGEVINATKRFIKVIFDVTDEGSYEAEIMRKKYNLRGLPAFVFIDSKGKIKKYTGSLTVRQLVDMLDKIE